MGRRNIIPVLFYSFGLHAVFFIYGFRDRILRARHAWFITIYNMHSGTYEIILLFVKIQTLWTFEVGPNSFGKILLKMNTIDECSTDGEKHTPCLRLAKQKTTVRREHRTTRCSIGHFRFSFAFGSAVIRLGSGLRFKLPIRYGKHPPVVRIIIIMDRSSVRRIRRMPPQFTGGRFTHTRPGRNGVCDRRTKKKKSRGEKKIVQLPPGQCA